MTEAEHQRESRTQGEAIRLEQGVAEAGGCCLFEAIGCMWFSVLAGLIALTALGLTSCDNSDSPLGGNRVVRDGPGYFAPPDPNPIRAIEFDGWEHCNWQHIRFLVVPVQQIAAIDANDRKRFLDFVNTTAAELPWTVGDFNPDADLPLDAQQSEYTDGERQLWFSPTEAGRGAYIVDGESVEWWPRFDGGCD